MENRVCSLFNIKYPIVSGGMVWCSGWRLASAVSKCGGLGLLGAGSMHPDNLRYHIRMCRENLGELPFGVNVPLLYPEMELLMKILIEEKVKIVFTSAGSPKKWTPYLKEHGIVVCHVVSSALFAEKCEKAGVDAVVAEGFEAGGHNGREETTTLCLVPKVREATSLPLLAAGGIALKCQIKAVEALGAEGVQIGTRFALSQESSAHRMFKEHCTSLGEGGTRLLLKKISPTRLAYGSRFTETVEKMEAEGADREEMMQYLGKGRAKRGIFEGDINEGEIEIGQACSLVNSIESVEQIMKSLI
ncbi:MAG: nitronate monooxygenase [Bacteroidetes bacterium]|uniref:Nitronate monooxygenase n=1 Tax=Candidatus Egerieousia excrementavium TaxID=2840778 RepID=A0A9D9DPR2_9BACT|nr:nitronate monooxygenase [Candidatus Egerieousia excrementavium]